MRNRCKHGSPPPPPPQTADAEDCEAYTTASRDMCQDWSRVLGEFTAQVAAVPSMPDEVADLLAECRKQAQATSTLLQGVCWEPS